MERINLVIAGLIVLVGAFFVAREIIGLRRQERRDEQYSAEFKALLRRFATEPHIILERPKYEALFQHHVYYHQLIQEVRDWCRDYTVGSDIRCWLPHGEREMTYCIFFANDDDRFAFQMRWRGCAN